MKFVEEYLRDEYRVKPLGTVTTKPYEADCGEYQGDSYLIIKNDDKYGYLNFGWGSCSGCDALQACTNIHDVQELMDRLYSQIQWFDSLKDLKEYFSTKDWPLDYAWYYDKFKDFVNKVINYEY